MSKPTVVLNTWNWIMMIMMNESQCAYFLLIYDHIKGAELLASALFHTVFGRAHYIMPGLFHYAQLHNVG